MTSEPFDEQLRHLNNRMDAVDRKYAEAFDYSTKLFQQSHNSLTTFLTLFTIVFGVVFALSAAAIGYQSYTTWQFRKDTIESFHETLEREKSISLRRIRILPYVARIDSGTRNLRSGTEGQKDVAIWDDLLGTLKASGSTPEFFDIVLEFKKVIPHLTIAREPAVFNNRDRAAIWIHIILLESGVDGVIDDIRRAVPPPETLRSWAAHVQGKIDPTNQQDFKTSVERLARGLRGR